MTRYQLVAIMGLIIYSSTAQADTPPTPTPTPTVTVGVLDCTVNGGPGYILGSNKTLKCTLNRPASQPERYTGTIKKYGLDIGITDTAHLTWTVIAPTNAPSGSLAGTYAGPTAEATIANGLGANVLVGGSANGIALQPLSLTTQSGMNIAAGVVILELTPQAGPSPHPLR